ncbi:MAG TPA: ankyrin repeat domain-containing protein [Gemmataceae bacterium]|nr:ankyrin repeat domain-containing protein [Gemmataceae bacterium]
MTTSLPPNPSIENLKKQAKTLKKAWQAGAADALERIRAVHPQYANVADDHLRTVKPRLTDCQLVLAREAGFASWPQLKVAVESANKDLPDQFVNLACLCFDDPHYDHRSFHVRAHEMLRQHPWLAEANIWSAATAGDTAAVKAFLDEDADLVSRPGPHGWVPLICACYARVKPVNPAHSTFAVAALLLKRGADANAYTMKGNADERLDQTARRFSAFTGILGGGSTGLANQPPHPRWRELAELLLQHDADPADEEALNHGHYDKNACLEILLRHGLNAEARTKRSSTADHSGAGSMTLLGRELSRAANRGQIEAVKLLLAHHARTDEKFEGKTPWEHALQRGHLEIARMLEEAGAPTSELNEVERFVSLCMAGDERGARAMAARTPDLLARAPKDLVHKAVGTKRKAAVKLVLDLGFDPNWQEDNAAIHEAGVLDENEEILRILLAHGASLTLRDPWYDGTAVGWAEFFDFPRLRDRLLNEGAICLFDALDHDRLDRVADILARDPAALNRPFAECISRKPRPEDWQTPLARMVERGKTEAVRTLLDHGADLTARHPDGRSLLQLARDKGFEEIVDPLEKRGA